MKKKFEMIRRQVSLIHLIALSVTQKKGSNDWIRENEMKVERKESIVTSFKVLYRHLERGIEENPVRAMS
jgi:hypothetical protein